MDASKPQVAYETLEPLRARDLGGAGDAEVDPMKAHCLFTDTQLMAAYVQRLLTAAPYEEWHRFCSSIQFFHEHFSDVRFTTKQQRNPYNSSKLMLRCIMMAKYANPETGGTEERDLAQCGFFTPWMVADRMDFGAGAHKVVHTAACTGKPFARDASGAERPEFVDQTFLADETKERQYGVERGFSGLVKTCDTLDDAVEQGILHDSIAHAKAQFEKNLKTAARPGEGTPLYNQQVATDALRFYHQSKSCKVDIPDDMRESMLEMIRADFSNGKNVTFMSYPCIRDDSAPPGTWATKPGTSSRARPELNLMEGQCASGNSKGGSAKGGGANAGASAASAPAADAGGSDKKEVTWGKPQCQTFKTRYGWTAAAPVGVAFSEAYFTSLGFRVEHDKPAISLVGLQCVRDTVTVTRNGETRQETRMRFITVEHPITAVAARHLARQDCIFRTRLTPKIIRGDTGLDKKLVVTHIQIIGFYGAIMNQPPLFGARGMAPTRCLAIEESPYMRDFMQNLADENPLLAAAAYGEDTSAVLAILDAPRPAGGAQKRIAAPPAKDEEPAAVGGAKRARVTEAEDEPAVDAAAAADEADDLVEEDAEDE